MKHLFEYNWQIRSEWFELLKTIPKDEFLKVRTGGHGSIAKTLFHVIQVEHNWIQDLKGFPISNEKFNDYKTLDKIKRLSNNNHEAVKYVVRRITTDYEYQILEIKTLNGDKIICTYGEALRHIIAHEIHHMGQISVWTREIGIKPINVNLIHRGLFIDNKV
ncbi:DinB family protein [Flavivirga sp. 57AJ16]|uniref:DinB family protein n=1 Tax=Flavivirga sp. 57AJ16 TaxID=3025307 RepID=UPI0023656ED7|nr:DinB family protein [Flavivirga sp. 57AJ16]MDD7886211.1 DinB family protein [Flavivirga sp. 57AJ16]